MKKFLCTLMALALVLTSLCAPAFARGHRFGDTYISSALGDDPILGDLEPYLCWSDAEYVRGELLCGKDHEHTDQCYDLVRQWTVIARKLHVDNEIKLKFDKEVEDIVVWVGYGNGANFDVLTQGHCVGSEFEVSMSRGDHYISYDSNDKSATRIKNITINYIIDNVYYTDGPYSWDDLYSQYKSNGGRFVFNVKTKSEGGVVIGGGTKLKTDDDSDTTASATDEVISALANLIEEQSTASAEDETETETSALSSYCTAYDYVLKSEDDETISGSYCPVCGQVSDGNKLTPIEHATVSGDEQEGEIKLHMGTLSNGESVLTACFTKNGEVVQPTGTVDVTIPMDYPYSIALAMVAEDGTESELPYTVGDDGCVTFSLSFEDGETVKLIHVNVVDSSEEDDSVKAVF